MDSLPVDDKVNVYQNVEQKHQDIFWKYKFFIFILDEQKRRHGDISSIDSGRIEGQDGTVHKRHRTTIQNINDRDEENEKEAKTTVAKRRRVP
jgi:hypothetical protein